MLEQCKETSTICCAYVCIIKIINPQYFVVSLIILADSRASFEHASILKASRCARTNSSCSIPPPRQTTTYNDPRLCNMQSPAIQNSKAGRSSSSCSLRDSGIESQANTPDRLQASITSMPRVAILNLADTRDSRAQFHYPTISEERLQLRVKSKEKAKAAITSTKEITAI